MGLCLLITFLDSGFSGNWELCLLRNSSSASTKAIGSSSAIQCADWGTRKTGDIRGEALKRQAQISLVDLIIMDKAGHA
jgi:hypothetical protein